MNKLQHSYNGLELCLVDQTEDPRQEISPKVKSKHLYHSIVDGSSVLVVHLDIGPKIITSQIRFCKDVFGHFR